MSLQGRDILLGVTGGIAAYKSADLVSRLRKAGANVHVVMTENATKFVTPLTFETMSANPVAVDTFTRPNTWEVEHIALAKRAELCIVAPATANVIAKLAHGLADDMLSTTLLAAKAPLLLAPAMNTGMWTAAATQENVQTLLRRGVQLVGPGAGLLACGDTGDGRMSEPAQIVSAADELLSRSRGLNGLHVLVTAGATRERLDPVRFLTNDSSGKMGFAVAEAARDRGADVTVIAGSTTAPVPAGIRLIRIESTEELKTAVLSALPAQDIVIQAAAPADYRPEHAADQKIKKQAGEDLVLRLVETPDVAAAVGQAAAPKQVLVGFAAETSDLLAHARQKLQKKRLDLIVANDVTLPGAGFNVDTNIATLISKDREWDRPLQSKKALANDLLDEALRLREQKLQ